ncbi:MAG: hypothetical protein N3H31_06820 [Candidatus Nezhaarchaeota archaeon]|nr:hypothetical protein [Candidatus Nezhaarchaeota archaeon]
MSEVEASKIHRVLSTMHLLSATSYDTSVGVEDLARLMRSMCLEEVVELMRRCLELDYVREVGGRYFLTYRGLISALSISS